MRYLHISYNIRNFTTEKQKILNFFSLKKHEVAKNYIFAKINNNNKFMKKAFSLLLIIFLHEFALAQTDSQQPQLSIHGIVTDKDNNETLPYAHVLVYSLPDSTFVVGASCDENGTFSVNGLEAKEYLIKATFIGYEDNERKVTLDTLHKDLKVKPLRLSPDKVMLEEVKILASATPLVVKEDTLVYNPEAFRVADGAVIEDLVKKLPGAELSTDGKLVINGKEIKKILVDGKEFFADDPDFSLKNLPANLIEEIKTYDKKSETSELTGVDDDDDETVLDLKVKKGMKNGWVGTLQGGGGSDIRKDPDFRYEASANMNRFTDTDNLAILGSINNTNNSGGNGRNVSSNSGNGITRSANAGITFSRERSKKYEFGGNVQYRNSKNDAIKKSARENFHTYGSSYRNDNSTSDKLQNTISSNLKMKWKPNENATIIFRPDISYSRNNSNSMGTTENLNELKIRNNYKSSDKKNIADNFRINGTLRYVQKLQKKGRSISLNTGITYTTSPSEQWSNSETDFYLDDDDIIDSTLISSLYTDKRSNGLTYYVEGAYTEPVFKNHSLQIKYRFQQRSAESYSLVYDEMEENSFLDSLSSEVENDYKTHIAEASLQGKYTKFNYNIGIAFQPQISKTHNLIGPNVGKDFEQTVFNFSPNLRFRYKFDKKNNLSFRYRGQSSAPNVEDLQMVIDESDPLDLKYGNPDLKPAYTNNITFQFKKYSSENQRSVMVNATFKNTLNAISNQIIYDKYTGIQESYKVNVNGNWGINGLFILSTPLKNKNFTFGNSTKVGYDKDVTLLESAKEEIENVLTDGEKSITHIFSAEEKLQLAFRNDYFDIMGTAAVAYQKGKNEIMERSNREIIDYHATLSANGYLPWNITLSTDVNFHFFAGYTDGFDDNALLWNAQLSKSFLPNNAATIKLKVIDILQQQNNLTRKIGESSITDTEYNTLGSYFILSFSYKINQIGKQFKEDD